LAKPNWRVWVSGGLLAVAIVFGGGGTPSPTTELIVELAALAAIVAWVWLAANDRRYSAGDIDRPLYVVAALFVAVPVLQLVPLPPTIWHNLPGREVEIQALALVGRDNAWMPWSVSPTHTIASALSLIPPITMLFMVSRLRERDRVTLIGFVAALGLLAAIVGVFQLAGGDANWFRFYHAGPYRFATGFQANRNADADVLLIAATSLAAWAAADDRFRRSGQSQLVIGALLLFLVLSAVLTGSRTGVALIAIVIVVVTAMFLQDLSIKRRRLIAAAVLILAAIFGSTYFLSNNTRIQSTLERFDTGDKVRPEIWKDTVYAIGLHWPAGSGIGTFQPVFASAERLEFVRPDFSNRAHNDFLEFALEAGVIAPVILIIMLIFTAVRLMPMLLTKKNGVQRTIGILVLGSLLVLLLHSLVDYPERSLSLAVVTGLLGGLLGRSGVGWGRRSEVLREL
jgi:O-antigen ligase